MVSTVVIAAAFASTGLISLAPNVLLFVFPQHVSSSSSWLSIGQALAAGGLLGDVFLHVIPHAATESSASESVGLWLLLGFSIFLIVDMIVRSSSTSGHHHHHSHSSSATTTDTKGDSTTTSKSDHNMGHLHHHNATSAVLLNLAADALHNFTDGLAIGSSFAYVHSMDVTKGNGSSMETEMDGDSSRFWSEFFTLLKSRGGLATLSILFHEIPHELGDYSTLIKEGFTQRTAIMAQFATAIAALIGTGVGLVAHEYAGDRLIFITAGGFVYLATVTILPDVLNETTSSGGNSTWTFRLSVLVAFAMGIGFLYAVSLLEEMDESGMGHGHSHSHHSHSYSHHQEVHHDHHDIHHDHHGHHGHHGHGHNEYHHDHHEHDQGHEHAHTEL